MEKVLRGYARDRNGNLVLIGTMPVPINKDKCPPAAHREKRRLVRQGATIFKKEVFANRPDLAARGQSFADDND